MIQLLPSTQKLDLTSILATAGATGSVSSSIFVADAYVQSAESWTSVPWGWQTDVDGVRIVNVDHHAPSAQMERAVSSGNLATVFVNKHGPATNELILINHCDCDSIVSSALLAGMVPPTAELEAAVIAADHTGEENLIADHLQALEKVSNLALSQQTLLQLLAGEPVSDQSRLAWMERIQERDELRSRINEPGLVNWTGDIAWIDSNERISAEMLTGLLSRAALIVISTPADNAAQPSRWVMKVRLGQAAVGKFTLDSIGVREFDPAFGGRWNAGSNKRGGGTDLDPHAYAVALHQRIQ